MKYSIRSISMDKNLRYVVKIRYKRDIIDYEIIAFKKMA